MVAVKCLAKWGMVRRIDMKKTKDKCPKCGRSLWYVRADIYYCGKCKKHLVKVGGSYWVSK